MDVTPLFEELCNVIDLNYSDFEKNASGTTNNTNAAIIAAIKEKRNGSSELSRKWKKLISDLKADNEGIEVIDRSFLEFPSLVLELVQKEVLNEDIEVRKKLVVGLSLLSPYYTYYFEYAHNVYLGKFPIAMWLPLDGIIFDQTEQFKGLRTSVDTEQIQHAIKANFTGYTLVSHYFLMINRLNKYVPYGRGFTQPSGFNLHQLLFDPTVNPRILKE